MGGPTPRAAGARSTPRAHRTPRGHSHVVEHVVELELYNGREREVPSAPPLHPPAPARLSTASSSSSSTVATRRAPGSTSLSRPSTPRTPLQRRPERSFTGDLLALSKEVSKCLTPVLAAAALVAMYVCVHESGHAAGAHGPTVHGNQVYQTPPLLNFTGGMAEDWCLLIHAEASLTHGGQGESLVPPHTR